MAKRIILFIITIFALNIANAEIVRTGNTFSTTQSSQQGDVLTSYTWKDSKGIIYPVYITKNGACYIVRISEKTGKAYKQYLPKEVQEQIKLELYGNIS